MRQAEIERNTFETKIKLSLNLDAQEPVDIQTGVGFFDHMLILFARHGRMSLVVKADGDLWLIVTTLLKMSVLSLVKLLKRPWAIKQVSTVMEQLLYLWMKPLEWQV